MAKSLIIYKKSTYELYSNSPDPKTRAYAETDSTVFRSHQVQKAALALVVDTLAQRGDEISLMYRGDFLTVPPDTEQIYVLGGDGTFLDTAHHLEDFSGTLMGINSDPGPSRGFLTACTAQNFAAFLESKEKMPVTSFNRLEVLLNNTRLPELVLNDVHICHQNPSAMVRYTLTADGKHVTDVYDQPRLRSSGLLVCAAAGSTAWMYEEGGEIMPLESHKMQYHERGIRGAPYWYAEKSLQIESLTREGKIYLDGEHLSYDFSLGDKVEIRPGKPLQVVGDFESKRRIYPQLNDVRKVLG